MSDKKAKDPKSKGFDTDSENTGSDMPSITRLLQRKKLGLSSKNSPKASESPPPVKEEEKSKPTEITLSHLPEGEEEDRTVMISGSNLNATNPVILSKTAPAPTPTPPPAPTPVPPPPPVAAAESAPQVKQSRRSRSKAPVTELLLWEEKMLKAGKDPLAKAITIFLGKGVKSVLFLSITTIADSQVPHFVATAAVNPGDKHEIWSGLKWNPQIVPELWNILLQSGFTELAPPGTVTNQQSNRNIMRAALGVSSSETLLLVRVGSKNAYRGIVAFVSDKSMLTSLALVIKDLHAASK